MTKKNATLNKKGMWPEKDTGQNIHANLHSIPVVSLSSGQFELECSVFQI